MGSIFEKFNQAVNMEEIKKQKEEAAQNTQQYKEVPAGKYSGEIEKMELGATNDGRPMFKVQFRITEGEFKKYCIFHRTVCGGTKNDGWMISQVEDWVNKLEPETQLEFDGNYDHFKDSIDDVAEEIVGNTTCEIEHEINEVGDKKFSKIIVKEVYDK